MPLEPVVLDTAVETVELDDIDTASRTLLLVDEIRITEDGETRITEDGETRILDGYDFSVTPLLQVIELPGTVEVLEVE